MKKIEIKFRAWDKDKKIFIEDYGNTTYLESFGWDNDYYIVNQFIGLTDCNQNEIYECDYLVNKYNGNKYNVFRVAGGFAINTHQNDFNRKTPFYTSFDMQTASYINGNCEVKGNIYQPISTTEA